jgi:hypothetical protein
MTARKQAPRAPGLRESLKDQLALAAKPLSSRRLLANGGFAADQQPHVSSMLADLRKQGLATVDFGSDPDFPTTDRVYSATQKLRDQYPQAKPMGNKVGGVLAFLKRT